MIKNFYVITSIVIFNYIVGKNVFGSLNLDDSFFGCYVMRMGTWIMPLCGIWIIFGIYWAFLYYRKFFELFV